MVTSGYFIRNTSRESISTNLMVRECGKCIWQSLLDEGKTRRFPYKG